MGKTKTDNESPLTIFTTTSWRQWPDLGFIWSDEYMNHDKNGKPIGPDMTYDPPLKMFLDAFGEEYRLNKLTKEIEQWMAVAPNKWVRTSGFDAEHAPMDIRDRIRARLGLKVTVKAMEDAVEHLANKKAYNPVVDYLDARRRDDWDGKTDYIGELFSHIILADDAPAGRKTYETMFRYALYQAYVLARNDGSISPLGCLVLQGPQGVGKTTLIRALAPHEYVKTGACIDPDNKDNVITNTSAWIVELGEAARTLRKVNALKAFLTSDYDYYRRPYAKNYIKTPRITSYFLTTNDDHFLLDDTGNRRFWVIPVKDIVGLDKIRNYNPDGLWAQVAKTADDAEEVSKDWWVMPPAIMRMINDTNEGYRVQGGAEMAIREYYDLSLKAGAPGSKKMTAMQVIDDITSHMSGAYGALTPVNVGRALSKMATRGEITKVPSKSHTSPAAYIMPPRRNERYDAATIATSPAAETPRAIKTGEGGEVIEFNGIKMDFKGLTK